MLHNVALAAAESAMWAHHIPAARVCGVRVGVDGCCFVFGLVLRLLRSWIAQMCLFELNNLNEYNWAGDRGRKALVLLQPIANRRSGWDFSHQTHQP